MESLLDSVFVVPVLVSVRKGKFNELSQIKQNKFVDNMRCQEDLNAALLSLP